MGVVRSGAGRARLDWISVPGPQPGVPRHPTAPGTRVSASRVSPESVLQQRMGKAGGWTLREGLLQLGAPGGRGSGVSSLRFFVQSRDFPSPPPYCATPHPRDPLQSLASLQSPGQKALPGATSGGADRGDAGARGQFPVCETPRGQGWQVLPSAGRRT